MAETVKALSLWQPWASLCCIAHPSERGRPVKGFETRSWRTHYRGDLLVHAAQRFTWDERDACFRPLLRGALRREYERADDLPRGAVVGRVRLVDCHPAWGVWGEADEYARAMGDYGPGRWAWEITEPVLFREPVPLRGRQGLFDVPLDALPDDYV